MRPLILSLFASTAIAQTHFADVTVQHYAILGGDTPYSVVWLDDDPAVSGIVGFGRLSIKDGQKVWSKTATYTLFVHDATGGGNMDQYWFTERTNWTANQGNLPLLLDGSWNFAQGFLIVSTWTPPDFQEPIVWGVDQPNSTIGYTSTKTAVIVRDTGSSWEWSIRGESPTAWQSAATRDEAKTAATIEIRGQ